MSRQRVAVLMAGAALFAASARGQEVLEAPGTLVGLSVQVEGRAASLYPAADGSGRYYLEARAGSRYALTLANRTGERVGVVLTVDGLNAISGERDAARGRMYVLDPWQSTSVQGWRTSLQDVRQFTFIDERAPTPRGPARPTRRWAGSRWPSTASAARTCARSPRRPRSRPGPTRSKSRTGTAHEPRHPPLRPRLRPRTRRGAPRRAEGKARSFPGTGWGDRAHDPVVLVSFDPESAPCERVTLRYEYRSALVALGILPPPVPRDRLWQREHAEPGFAQAPRW